VSETQWSILKLHGYSTSKLPCLGSVPSASDGRDKRYIISDVNNRPVNKFGVPHGTLPQDVFKSTVAVVDVDPPCDRILIGNARVSTIIQWGAKLTRLSWVNPHPTGFRHNVVLAPFLL